MVDALAPEAYQKALYRHMYRIVPLLERIDAELENAIAAGACEKVKCLKAVRSISVFGLFDFDFYAATYRHVPETEFEALEHYVKQGEADGLKPNVAFSSLYYRDRAMADSGPDQNALQHYSEIGERLGDKASLAFDPRAYLQANPTLAAFVDRPLFHFLKLGLPAGLPVQPPLNSNSELTGPFNETAAPVDQAHWRRLKGELNRVDQCPMPQTVGRNLVMGLALNYRKADLAPFVRSLRATGYDGDITLWVSALDPETQELFEEYRVHYEYYWEMSFSPFNFMLARNFSYYRYLCDIVNRRTQTFDRILLTDVADVVFQADPFATAPGGDLVVFLEDKVRTLDTCYVDSYWIRSAFGDLALNEVRGRRMSCAGTVLGTWAGILRYLLVMQLGAFECAAPARSLEGIDQAIHNVMLYRGRLSGAVIVENAEHVFTMGIVPKNHVAITQDGRITDRDGRICPIVHQYNRHPPVTRLIQEQYIEIRDTADV
jgi:hypothetical protein